MSLLFHDFIVMQKPKPSHSFGVPFNVEMGIDIEEKQKAARFTSDHRNREGYEESIRSQI
jgi:hypothetical protein